VTISLGGEKDMRMKEEGEASLAVCLTAHSLSGEKEHISSRRRAR